MTLVGAATAAQMPLDAAELAYCFIDASYRSSDGRELDEHGGLPGVAREYRRAVTVGKWGAVEYVNAGIEGYGWGALKIDGGLAYFPGLSKPITIDGNTLPAQEADTLKHLLDATHFFDLPQGLNAPAPGAADYRQYTITVDDDSKHHTVQMTAPIEEPNLQALLSYLKTRR